MKSKISTFVRSHPRLMYAARFFLHLGDKRFFMYADSVHGSSRSYSGQIDFHFEERGKQHQNKALYLIQMDTFPAGLLAFFTGTVRYLLVCSVFGFTPSVRWTTRQYAKDKGLQDNVFTYYFEPCGVPYEDALQGKYAAVCNGSHYVDQVEQVSFYVQTDEMVAQYAQVVKRYIALNAPTQAFVERGIDATLGGKKTLGVHVRGGFRVDKNKLHPRSIDPNKYVQAAQEALQVHGFEQIFLATDEDDTLDIFQSAFGDRLVYYNDVKRVPHGREEDLSLMAFKDSSERPNNGYLMGLEVLRDVYTLAACQGLVAGYSNVVSAAMYINGDTYEHKQILFEGLYGV